MTSPITPPPEPVAPTDEEIMEVFWEHQNGLEELWADDWPAAARAVLAKWGTPAIQPVPVSERLPDPEECDAEGGCWWWHPATRKTTSLMVGSCLIPNGQVAAAIPTTP